MSWDIVALGCPADIKTVADMPPGFEPSVIGKRSEIITMIQEVVPNARSFSDPSWVEIDGPGWSIEVNLGETDECAHFSFYVRGGDGAAGIVSTILEHLKVRAIDTITGEFFVPGPQAVESLRKWRAYRDHVLGSR